MYSSTTEEICICSSRRKTSIEAIFDTETAKLHGDLIAIAMIIVAVDEKGQRWLSRVCRDLIAPHAQLVIDPGALAVHHISRKRLEKYGRPLLCVLMGLANVLGVAGGGTPSHLLVTTSITICAR